MAQVERDGSFKMIDMSNRGGRAFFGLGTLLTGYKVNWYTHTHTQLYLPNNGRYKIQ